MGRQPAKAGVSTLTFGDKMMMRKVGLLPLLGLVSIISSCSSDRVEPIAAEDCLLDIETGLVSRVAPTEPLKDLKIRFPFHTGFTAEGGGPDSDDNSGGGGLFFLDHNLFFYTAIDRVELRRPCKIAVSDDAFAQDYEYYETRFGPPFESWDSGIGSVTHRFTTAYGYLEVRFDGDGSVWDIAACHAPHRTEHAGDGKPDTRTELIDFPGSIPYSAIVVAPPVSGRAASTFG